MRTLHLAKVEKMQCESREITNVTFKDVRARNQVSVLLAERGKVALPVWLSTTEKATV